MEDYKSWQVGDEIVFIGISGDYTLSYSRGEKLPSIDETYTIRAIGIDKASGKVCLMVNEIINEVQDYAPGRYEAAFPADSFRKLQKKKTDISAFKTMLSNDLAKNRRELEEKEKEDDLQTV
jgi:hypothetical protein